jgi:hypothetical protein
MQLKLKYSLPFVIVTLTYRQAEHLFQTLLHRAVRGAL